MTEAMTLNMGPFATLSCDEMFIVDGGAWGARQWTAAGLIVAGGVCLVVSIWCPPAAAGAAKAWGTAGTVLATAGGVLAIG